MVEWDLYRDIEERKKGIEKIEKYVNKRIICYVKKNKIKVMNM